MAYYLVILSFIIEVYISQRLRDFASEIERDCIAEGNKTIASLVFVFVLRFISAAMLMSTLIRLFEIEMKTL